MYDATRLRQRYLAMVGAALFALLGGVLEWLGVRPGPIPGPFPDPVPLSAMWWHVPVTWIVLFVGWSACRWIGERL